MSLKRRIIEAEQQTKLAAGRFERMFKQCQQEFGLPLPDGIPAEVRQEAERRIVAMQSALKANPDDHSPAHEFRDWVLSVHHNYG